MRIIASLFLLIIGIWGSITPLYSQSHRFLDKDTTYTITTLNAQQPFTFLYFENPDSATSYTDSVMAYTYNPSLKTWIPAKLINISENTETTAGSPILLTDGIKKVFAFYELYLYGFKVRRLNTVVNNNPLYMFAKSTGR